MAHRDKCCDRRGGRRRRWHPTPVLLPGKSHGRRSLVCCSPWGRKESDTTEQLPFHFSLSCIGEGNGNPLQCACLENPRDGGAWWAAVYGVAQHQTRLKRLSSSRSSNGAPDENLNTETWVRFLGWQHYVLTSHISARRVTYPENKRGFPFGTYPDSALWVSSLD